MSLIDADELMKECAIFVAPANNSDFAEVPTWNDAISLIGSAPTIDAVPVVRCKDCKWYGTYQLTKYGEYDKRYKPTVCIKGEYSIMRNEDWYCADGERREE